MTAQTTALRRLPDTGPPRAPVQPARKPATGAPRVRQATVIASGKQAPTTAAGR